MTLLALASAQFAVIFDTASVYVALPSIGSGAGLSPTNLQWVITVYALAFGGLLLLGGRAGDVFGRRKLFVAASLLFAGASGGIALTPSAAYLIALRAVQGIAAALLLPSMLGMVGTVYREGRERDRALSLIGVVGVAGSAAGSLAGGLLVGWVGWRWIFVMDALITAVGALVASAVLPRDPDRRRRTLELPGAMLAALSVVMLVYALGRVPRTGWRDPFSLGSVLVAAIFFGGFRLKEAWSADPLLPAALLRRRTLMGAVVVGFLFEAAFVNQLYLLTLYVQQVRGRPPAVVSALFLFQSALVMGGTSLGGRLATRLGARAALMIGMGVGTGGLLSYTLLTPRTAFPSGVAPGLMVAGLGQGIAWTAYWSLGLAGMGHGHSGIASSLISAANLIGRAVGLAFVVAVSAVGSSPLAAGPGSAGVADAWAAALRRGFFTISGLAALGALAALVMVRRTPRSRRQRWNLASAIACRISNEPSRRRR